MCVNAKQPTEPRVAIIENQTLLSLETQENDLNRSCGNIYLGTITSVQPGIDAVFVDFGSQRHGFLPFKEILPEHFIETVDKNGETTKKVTTGTKVLVQVNREEKSNKGAALTTFLALAGAYMVLMPNNSKNNGISKKADQNERAKLKEVLSQLDIPEGLSVIVRTEGINRSKDELAWDLECLLHHWKKMQEALETAPNPSLIHQEADTLIRSVRDRLRKNITSIVVDHEPTYSKLKVFLELTRPEFADRLTLYTNKVPIFTHFGVQEDINSLFLRKVHLKSGGSIVIDYTEAMTVIDVNSSKSTNAKNIEDTALETNLEAAKETIKQLSLRGIGGIIVIDFIDMTAADSRDKVEQIFEGYINAERAKMRFEPISALTGCMYISRQRPGPSITDQHYVECKSCNGLGFNRSILSIANTILHKAEDNSVMEKNKDITIQTSPNVACYILNEKREHINQIERMYQNKIIIVANEQYIDSKYTFKRSNGGTTPSYEQKEISEPQTKLHQYPGQAQPIVPQDLYKEHPKQQTTGNAIQRFMNIILPGKESQPKVYTAAETKSKPTSRNNQNQNRRDGTSPGNIKRPRRRSRSNNRTKSASTANNNVRRNPNSQRHTKPDAAMVSTDRLDD
ncbi:Rne/Rng family ribonuclease [Candidatus Synchoanobacter obligatus]|uniref:Ribonuclease G n=1 Tax=Candidatus Synchoanobacter obligatus TaxID=2919597 RepID=A0ABT1L3J2_9GAMM|nr:Rne/Rng family ribonuclease [Candidatus Synchoanobacter obligatus]MCP8351773.1 Rne/Rng family ribonuclease [Candidatus Synchoanobacter obligatus]